MTISPYGAANIFAEGLALEDGVGKLYNAYEDVAIAC